MMRVPKFVRFLPLLGLLLLAVPVFSQSENPEEEKSWFLGFVERQLSAPNRQIAISEIQGVLSSKAAIGKITVADRQGVWLTITNARIDWSRLALLRGRLDINTLAADSIDIARKPLPDESLPSPESSGFQMPELPVAVYLRQLDVPRLALGPNVVGPQAEIKLAGNISLDDGSLDSNLQIQRLDGPGGEFTIKAAFDNADKELDLDVNLTEPANGLVANVLSIEGRPPVVMQITGSGPLSDLSVDLSLDAANKRVMAGQLLVNRQEAAYGFDARLNGQIAGLIPQQFRGFFGAETALAATGSVRDAGGFVLSALTIDGNALNVQGSAETTTDGFLRKLTLNAAIANKDGQPVVLPVAGGNTRAGQVKLTMDYGNRPDNTWVGKLAIVNFSIATLSARDVTIDAQGLAENLDSAEARSLTYDIKGAIAGIASPRADIAAAIGSQITLAVNGDWKAGAPLNLAKAEIAGNGLSAALRGTVQDYAYEGDILLKAANLTPFSDLAGRPLSGALDLTARGTVKPISGAFDLTFDGRGTNMDAGVAAVTNLLRGETRLTGALARNENGIAARELRVSNDRMRVQANGNFGSDNANFAFGMDLDDLAVLSPQAQGALKLTGTAQGQDKVISLKVDANVPSGRLVGRALQDAKAGFDGRLVQSDLSGNLTGDAFLGGVRIDLRSALALTQEGRQLRDLVFNAGGTRLSGNLNQNPEGLIEGRLDLAASDISTAAALFLMDAKGKADAAIVLNHENGQQNVDLKGQINGLRSPVARVGKADIALVAQNIFGVPVANGSLTGSDISAGGVDVARLSAKADAQGRRTAFDVDAALTNNARLTADGALEPNDKGFAVSLAQARLARGDVAARLVKPAAVFVEGSNVRFDTVVLDVGQGQVSVKGAVTDKLDLDVAIRNLPLSIANMVKPDLALGGQINGTARITGARNDPQGAFNLTGSGLTARLLQLNGLAPLQLNAEGRFANQAVALSSARVSGPQGLNASASGTAPLSGNGLDINAEGAIPLALANRFLIERGTQLRGTINVKAVIRGNATNPQINGSFAANGAQVVDPQSNVRLQQITLNGSLDGDRVSIGTFNAALASGGTISASGSVSTNASAGFPADIKVNLNRARYADGQLVVATVSGGLALTGPVTAGALLGGDVRIERAEITVPERFGGSAAAIDVRHKNTPRRVQQTLARAKADQGGGREKGGAAVPMRINLTINAPNQIFVRGRGLDAEIGGSVQLGGTLSDVQPVGGFELIRGRLGILGQRITFTKGQVTLTGNLDPDIDFLASTESGDTVVNVAVRGRVSDPQITFFSQPELPQDEVLARLIFNRSISELSAFQIARLAAAASELTGGGNSSLLGSLRAGTGLDDLDVTTDSEGNAGVRAGRYIRDNIYLGVEAGAGGDTKGTINLDITKDIKAKGSVGSDGSSGAGLFFERDY